MISVQQNSRPKTRTSSKIPPDHKKYWSKKQYWSARNGEFLAMIAAAVSTAVAAAMAATIAATIAASISSSVAAAIAAPVATAVPTTVAAPPVSWTSRTLG